MEDKEHLCMADDPDAGGQAMRSSRSSVMLRASVEHLGGSKTTQHRVRDLSAGGMRIDQAANISPGSSVLVTLGALQSIAAAVIWVKGDSAGLKFADPIDIDEARSQAAVAPRRGLIHPGVIVAQPLAGFLI